MKDIPIIFSGPMVQALLADRKTMTRRLAWRSARKGADAGGVNDRIATPWQLVCPGDRFWVRENLTCVGDGLWKYAADRAGVMALKASESTMVAWAHHEERGTVPSIHMPRWASRLTLIVTARKIEPLQALSEADAVAEGVSRIGADMPWAANSFKDGPNFYTVDMGDGALSQPTAAGTFALLWKCLHGEEAWDANPEVVALTFRVIKANIDAPEALAA